MKQKIYFSPLISFSLILFLINLGDALMSYIAPVYIQNLVSNTFIMGIVLSTTSLVGFFCDFIFPKFFANRTYKFFSWATIICALIYSGIFITLPTKIFTILFAMIVWGVYYEFLRFSHFRFIAKFLPQKEYASGWGISSAFRSASYLVGPLIAILILSSGFRFSFLTPFATYAIGGIGLLIFIKTKDRHSTVLNSQNFLPLDRIIKIWLTLWKKVWLIYLFLFSLTLIDSAFWSIGIILSEELRSINPLAEFIIPIYILPSLFIGPLVQKLTGHSGKKSAAFISGSLSGALLIPLAFTTSIPLILITILLSSIFNSLAFPEICAVFEDYVHRLGHTGDEMIGLEGSAMSLAYIIGPIFAGFLSTQVGNLQTLSIIGGLVLATSLISLFFVPRKIRLPQTEISTLIG